MDRPFDATTNVAAQTSGRTRMLRQAWVPRVGLAALSLVLSLALAEALVRLLWTREHPRQAVVHAPDPEVALVLLPGSHRLPFRRCVGLPPECRSAEVRFTVNSQGFRARSDFSEPAARPLIVVLGDSQLEARQVDDEATACSRVAELLRTAHPSAEVRNLGVASSGFVHYHARWRRFAAAMKPDVVVIGAVGMNDFRNSSPSIEPYRAVRPTYFPSPEGRRYRFEAASDPRSTGLRRHLGAMVAHLELYRLWRFAASLHEQEVATERELGRDAPLDVGIFEQPPNPGYEEAVRLGAEYLAETIREAHGSGAQVVIVYVPTRNEALDVEWSKLENRYRASGAGGTLDRARPEVLVRDVAQRSGARFVSFSDILRQRTEEDRRPLWFTKTDSHLTEAGHQLLAGTIYQAIVEALSDGVAR